MRGLIGSSGFVGSALAQQRRFDRAYSSKTIERIAGEHFELVVCAAAPAIMWAANANPEADAAKLNRLLEALRSADIRRLVLISTIAVFDDASAGYTESNGRFEQHKPYGRNRRMLEVQAMASFDCHIVRLPALFGPGLRKNFIFDLMHPVPSYISSAKRDALMRAFGSNSRELLMLAFAYDEGVAMWKLDRGGFGRHTKSGALLETEFRRAGFLARSFTNSQSRFQFYNIERLAQDIDTCLHHRLRVLNVCSVPMGAAEIHQELTGQPFENNAPPLVVEDVRSEFAPLFGQSGPYLYTAEQVLRQLKAFADRQAP
jgi:hypothetical protein